MLKWRSSTGAFYYVALYRTFNALFSRMVLVYTEEERFLMSEAGKEYMALLFIAQSKI